MIKTSVCFEVEKEERIYRFYCETDAPLGEIFDVLCMMKSQIVERINAVEIKPEEKKDG